jgi:uncharacterized protein (TIGR03083 family)
MDLTRTPLIELGLDLIEAAGTDVPAGMHDRILAAAMDATRPTIHAAWASAPGELSSHAAFITTASELGDLLGALAHDDWTRRTEVDGGASVRDLVQHLVGVERYLLGQLGRRDPIAAPTVADHFPVLRRASSDLDGAADADVARAWWLEVLQLIAASAELGPDQSVAYHHLSGSLRGMLVIRTFELWTHHNDIRRAVGLPTNELDERRLTPMSSSLMGSLSGGMALSGTARPGRTARITLTGLGRARTFDVALTPGGVAGDPDIVIEVNTIDLCRLAANRLSRDMIDVKVDGDRSLLEPILVGATAFAMD